MHTILNKGVKELLASYRDKTLGPVDAVKAFIAQIEKVNPKLNAVVVTRFSEALKEAVQAEKRIKNGEAGLLEGIPCTVKETISVKGYPSTYGSVYRKNNKALKDAPIVSNLKKEGAIILGFTNTPECCFWLESNNNIYGRTNNPYDLGRTCGGSSGGEGAIVAAGGAPFGVGSDIAGSIRMPAAFCGIFGHAPSAGMVSIEGHYPYDFTSVKDFTNLKLKSYLKIGPMTRKAEDLYPLLRVFAGKGQKEDFEFTSFKKDWRRTKVFTLPNPSIKNTSNASPDLQQSVISSAKLFEQAGAEIEPLDPKLFYNIFEIWQTLLRDAADFSLSEMFGNGKKVEVWKEGFKFLAGKSDITFPGLIMCMGENVFKPSDARIKILIEEGNALRSKLNSILSDNGLLIMPVHPSVAPKHNLSFLTPFNWNYTTMFNALGNPATSVPTGFNKENLPLAVQLAAKVGNDKLCCDAAVYLEKCLKPVTVKMNL